MCVFFSSLAFTGNPPIFPSVTRSVLGAFAVGSFPHGSQSCIFLGAVDDVVGGTGAALLEPLFSRPFWTRGCLFRVPWPVLRAICDHQ